MKIEVWSDYVCPFCYIGKRRLEEAIELTGLAQNIDVQFKAYQLDPSTPTISEKSTYERLAEKYQTTVEAAKQMTTSVNQQAQTVGLKFDFDNAKAANTFDAHRLAKWAEAQGKPAEASERLLKAYFIEAQEIGRHEVLLNLIEEIGLDRTQAAEVLSSNAFEKEVKQEIEEGMSLGVQGVPFFVINRKYAISGAQPAEAFAEALRKVAEEEGISSKLQTLGQDNVGICKDDNCEI
ncbi:DsbA family oxidoreductase [Paenisporosarcina antarctica]|uniref:DsbA family oxidoreductase n=1 Tax=Paenisporosarcina antarctica TaxID=417367 RepID=A0A4P6ZWW6_9BACL|nr:DsbA family oxidoreductase [Paenisporosarcina antarctica]QBP39986.1 DsbA family oxidoreductase [Paenisporosarcina antarctica]